MPQKFTYSLFTHPIGHYMGWYCLLIKKINQQRRSGRCVVSVAESTASQLMSLGEIFAKFPSTRILLVVNTLHAPRIFRGSCVISWGMNHVCHAVLPMLPLGIWLGYFVILTYIHLQQTYSRQEKVREAEVYTSTHTVYKHTHTHIYIYIPYCTENHWTVTCHQFSFFYIFCLFRYMRR